MEEHSFLLVDIANKILGDFVLFIYSIFGIKSSNPGAPIPAHIVFAVLVAIFIIVFFKLISKKPSLLPNPLQSFAEYIYSMFDNLMYNLAGDKGRKYTHMIGTIGIFIFCCNIAALFPGFEAPTSNLNVTVGSAIFVFIYYNFQGIKEYGILKYIKHLAGPYPALAPIFFPIEIISHLSRPLSLSIRLFGNIMGEDMVIIIIASLVPYIVPLPMMAFAIFTSFVQALVFTMLSAVYIAGAVASEEH